MDEHLHHPKHEYNNNQKHPDKQDELAGALKEDAEVMKHDLKYLVRLAQYCFDTTGSIDYGKITGEEVQVGSDAHLYTLITYNGKDILVQVGTGEYTTAVFTKKGIQETRGLRNSPLPLFVVTARADQEQTTEYPRRFLNEHTMIYSPKGGQAELRIYAKDRKKSIDYGKSNGIMSYEKAVTTLQNAIIKKTFYDRKTKNNLSKRFVDEMKHLQNKDFEQFIRRYEVKPEFYSWDKKSIAFRACLDQLGDGKLRNIYELIERFDPQSGTFTPLHN